MYKMTCLAVAPHSSVQHNGSGRKHQQLRPGCKGGGDGLPDQKGLRSSVLGIPYQVHPPRTFSLRQRNDLSGTQVGGNKVRKLEFLMADAVAKGADCVITIGSIQSNHCCATAVAAKHLNLDDAS